MSDFLRAILTQPLFNLLIVIYALIPGNDFGVALLIFTLIIRLLMWPLLKKQLHHQKAMRELQPEIEKIKKRAKGDRNKVAQLTMELYKEREINPFGSLGIILIQFPILIALFLMLRGVVDDHATVERLSYDFVSSLGAVRDIIQNPGAFEPYLLGIVDLSQQAISRVGENGGFAIYWPAVPFVFLAGIGQFFQTKQLMASREKAKTLKQLLNDAKQGKEVDPADQQAAITTSMVYVFPVLTVVIAFGFPVALSLYWAASSVIAVFQQRAILEQDVEELAQTAANTNKSEQTKTKSKKKKAGKKKGAK